MAKKRERKFAKVSVEIDGKTYRRSVSYYTLPEFTEKKKKAEEALYREHTKKFKDIADAWQTEHDKDIQTYTQSCYKAPLKDLKDEFGDLLLSDITSIMFQAFLEKMASQGYAKQTINLRKIVMKQIFDYALFNGIVNYNPITVCKPPKKACTNTRELPSDKDIETIKSNFSTLFGLYCNLLMYTGLRREEALALNYEDIDFERNTVHISKAVIFENNRPIIRDSLKSKSGERNVPLLDPLKDIFIRQNLAHNTGLIFSFNGKPLRKGDFDKGFNEYRKQTGITCTSHQLRHYFATLCFDADLDEKDVQDIMGHSKISLTKDIYTHIRKQRKEKSTQKLNNFICEMDSSSVYTTESTKATESA